MSEIDFSGLKKKKKKAVVESFESLTLESQGGSEKEEIIDFSELKKKKKKKGWSFGIKYSRSRGKIKFKF